MGEEARTIAMVARALYDAMRASADHAFIGEFSEAEPVTIDGEFDLVLAADIIVKRLLPDGLNSSNSDRR